MVQKRFSLQNKQTNKERKVKKRKKKREEKRAANVQCLKLYVETGFYTALNPSRCKSVFLV